MTTRKKKQKGAKRTLPSVRTFFRAAHKSGHDALDIMHDPEALGLLEFTMLVRNLTARLAVSFDDDVHRIVRRDVAKLIGEFLWEPVAQSIVRAMIRTLSEVTRVNPTDGGATTGTYSRADLTSATYSAVESVQTRLGKAQITTLRRNRIVDETCAVFADPERFTNPAQLRCRNVPYTFHRQDDQIVVTRG